MSDALEEKTTSPVAAKDSQALKILEGIHFFSSKIGDINASIIAASNLAKQVGSGVPEGAEGPLQALPVVGFALASLDIIRIPMLYLAFFLLGEEVPFKLEDKAKIIFSGLVLGLGISALLIPVAAPFLMLATTVTLLSSSVFTWKLLVDKNREDKAAIELLINKEPKTPDETKELHALQQNQNALSFLDNGVGFGIRSLMVVGAVLSVLAIPAAPFLFIAAGLSAGTYMVGGLVAPFVTRLARWMMGTPEKAEVSSPGNIPASTEAPVTSDRHPSTESQRGQSNGHIHKQASSETNRTEDLKPFSNEKPKQPTNTDDTDDTDDTDEEEKKSLLRPN